MRKIILITAVFLFILTVCTGCVGVQFVDNINEGIRGTGPMTEVVMDVEEYHGVVIDYVVNCERAEAGQMKMIELVYSNRQPSGQVRISLQENLMDYLQVKVENGILIIGSEYHFEVDDAGQAHTIYINEPQLDYLSIEGTASVTCEDPITADSFILDVEGAADLDLMIETENLTALFGGMCEAKLAIETENLTASFGGMCEAKLTGTARTISMDFSGAGDIDALGLAAQEGKIRMSGIGNMEVNCSETLDIQMNGAGSFLYKGSPALTMDNDGNDIEISQTE